MKKFVIVLGLLIACKNTLAQLPTKDGEIFYEKVDTITGTKDALYIKAKGWFVNTFKDANKVIQMDDKETGQLMGKGNFPVSYTYLMQPVNAACNFTVKVDLKDNKYRIQLYNFNLGDQGFLMLPKLNKEPDKALAKRILPKISSDVDDILTSFAKAMKESLDSNF